MYTVKVQKQFSSAHNLRGYKGKCEEVHGHNWRVEVTAVSQELDGIGMVLDFKVLKNVLIEILDDLDHKHLNELEYFKDINPTSENLARYVYDRMTEKMKSAKIAEVTVWETDTASATYFCD